VLDGPFDLLGRCSRSVTQMARAYLVQYRIALLPYEVGSFIAELIEFDLPAIVESEIDQAGVQSGSAMKDLPHPTRREQ